MSDGTPRQSVLAQERSRKTYRALVDAARELWWDRGFDDVPVGEICERAGVAKGTFYFYFPKKEDLLIELGMSALDAVHDHVTSALDAGDPARQVLDSTMDLIGDRAGTIPRHILKRVSEETMRAMDRFDAIRGDHPSYGEIFTAVFSAAQQQGELPAHYHPAELGSMLSWTVVQAQHMLTTGHFGEADFGRVLRRRARLFWNGASVSPKATTELGATGTSAHG